MTEKLRPTLEPVEDRDPIRCGWNPSSMLVRGTLTDARISKYQKSGWYSAEFKKARLDRMKAKEKRQGNFVVSGGRMIYSPL